MKYTTEVMIDLPRQKVLQLLDDPENMKHWQRGLQGYKMLSGNPGTEGAKMELHYKMGKREILMIETIIKQDLPDEWHATYDAKGVHNLQKNYFHDLDGKRTHWVSETTFEFSGLFMKLMGKLMPKAFKKQSQKYLEDFKAFAEQGTSVANS